MPNFLKSQGHSPSARAASFGAARVPGRNEWKTVIAGIAEPAGTGSTSQHLTTAAAVARITELRTLRALSVYGNRTRSYGATSCNIARH
jgi:hypothetical protein